MLALPYRDLLPVRIGVSFNARNGFVDVYDTTAKANQLSFQVAKEMYSAALLCGGKMLVCGDKEHLYFNEVETGKQVAFVSSLHLDWHVSRRSQRRDQHASSAPDLPDGVRIGIGRWSRWYSFPLVI